MANPFRGESQIGTSDIVLVCDINAICEIRAYLGGDPRSDAPLDEMFDRIGSGELSLTDQRAILAALLRNKAPGVTARAAGEVMSDHPGEIMPAIRRAVQRAMPEPEPEPDSEDDPAGKPQRR